jgi:predicted lipoprotein with Yx(FWY)xxD motif
VRSNGTVLCWGRNNSGQINVPTGLPPVLGVAAGGAFTIVLVDLCPNDPNKSEPGACGCGVPDTDSDSDGVADCNDNCDPLANPDQADTNGNGFGDVCEWARGDLNLDGTVNGDDVLILVANWGLSGLSKGDINFDGQIEAKDITKMLKNWGTGPS